MKHQTIVTGAAVAPPTSATAVVFSYARPEQPMLQRALIRAIETLSGRRRFERLYHAWRQAPRDASETLFSAGVGLLGVAAQVDAADLARIPSTGPLLVVANHPFGIADGLAIGHLLASRRADVKLMVHSLLCQPPEGRDLLLPVDFAAGAAARRVSAETRRQAVDWLDQGHCLIVFPAGSISTAAQPLARHAVDAEWHPFVARLAQRPGVQTLPLFVHGQNSRLFQIVSHFSYPLRLALIFSETRRRCGRPLQIEVGATIPTGGFRVGKAGILAVLRAACYGMAGADGPRADQVFVWPKRIKF